jgi:hypothetical protein
MLRRLLTGAAAGATATTALNAVTYADMAWRARPASSAPEKAVEQLATRVGQPVPGIGAERTNRLSGLGALSGIGVGVMIGAVYGLLAPRPLRRRVLVAGTLLGAAAMAASDVPLVRLGVTDPRTWSRADWLSDAVPHLAYGLVTAWAVSRAAGRTTG